MSTVKRTSARATQAKSGSRAKSTKKKTGSAAAPKAKTKATAKPKAKAKSKRPGLAGLLGAARKGLDDVYGALKKRMTKKPRKKKAPTATEPPPIPPM